MTKNVLSFPYVSDCQKVHFKAISLEVLSNIFKYNRHRLIDYNHILRLNQSLFTIPGISKKCMHT